MERQIKKYTLIVSILLHLVLFFLFDAAIRLGVFVVSPQPLVENAPIVFDLQQPDLPREVIETPDDAKTVEKQENADFLSDKNALARNPETDPDLTLGEAYAKGDFESHDLPAQQGNKEQQPVPESEEEIEKDKKKLDESLVKNSSGVFFRDYVMKSRKLKPENRNRLPGVNHDNQKTRALDMGGLSFNTYDWNFAPYLLELKRIIRSNIFPPIAFTRLGMISGETLLRFRIYPSGEMQNLVVLGYRGDKSLMKTSYSAVEISAPFPKLPADFPEPYLEVTGKFLYLIRKANKNKRGQ